MTVKNDKLRQYSLYFEGATFLFAFHHQNNGDLPKQPMELALFRQQPAFTSTCLVFINHQTLFLAGWKGAVKQYVDPLDTETHH